MTRVVPRSHEADPTREEKTTESTTKAPENYAEDVGRKVVEGEAEMSDAKGIG